MLRVLLDTNLLLVFIVGQFDSDLVGKAAKVKEYSADDYGLLCEVVGTAQELVVTTHILTELDNLIGRFREDQRVVLRRLVADQLSAFKESQPAAASVVGDPLYERLGLSDAAIARLSKRCVVWTNDRDLYLAIQGRTIPAVFFEHARSRRR